MHKPNVPDEERELVQRAWDGVSTLPPIDFSPDEASTLLAALSSRPASTGEEVEWEATDAEAVMIREMQDQGLTLDEACETVGGLSYVLQKAGFEISRPAPSVGVGERWTCFHCGEIFTDRTCAARHFGPDEDAKPACLIKAGAEGSLLRALRDAEASAAEAWGLLHAESGDFARAYHAAVARHSSALTNAEELGYERGLADGRALTVSTTNSDDGRKA